MANIHIVEDGEHLPGIAAKAGFSSFRPILDHPENAELKKLRPNPNVLVPGDRIFIPEKELREEEGPTGQRTRLETAGEILELRVKVLDLSEKALTGPCDLALGLDRLPMKESSQIFSAPIPTDAKRATMEFAPAPPAKSVAQNFPLFIGGLDDVKEFSGQQQRLNNLGYFAGFAAKSTVQFAWAVEEFQADHLAEIGLPKPTGVCDAKTQKILLKKHGV